MVRGWESIVCSEVRSLVIGHRIWKSFLKTRHWEGWSIFSRQALLKAKDNTGKSLFIRTSQVPGSQRVLAWIVFPGTWVVTVCNYVDVTFVLLLSIMFSQIKTTTKQTRHSFNWDLLVRCIVLLWEKKTWGKALFWPGLSRCVCQIRTASNKSKPKPQGPAYRSPAHNDPRVVAGVEGGGIWVLILPRGMYLSLPKPFQWHFVKCHCQIVKPPPIKAHFCSLCWKKQGG